MQTIISKVSDSSLQTAKNFIKNGDVVAFHTETVYGLGADACCNRAVAHIFELKGRPADNPLIAHVHRDFDISSIVDRIPEYAKKLQKAFLPGPLTMVYPSKGKVSALVSCGLDTLAVRIPSSETAQAFLRAVDIPIAAPSANLSKHISPVTAMHVYEDFHEKIPLILDGGACQGGIESTVLDCTGEIPLVLRAGLVTREMIEDVVGVCGTYVRKDGEKPKSPGMAYKHYAPRCRTALFQKEQLEEALALYEQERVKGGKPCILCESSLLDRLNGYETLDLGDSAEQMANRLYAQLHNGEKNDTLLIGIYPSGSGGVFEGVINRFARAFGGEA